MARFTVTVDLPTPPLPDDTPMTRVLDVGSEEGRHGCGGRVPVPAVVVPVAVVVRRRRLGAADHAGPQPVPQLGPLLVVHHDELELDLLHAGAPTAAARWISSASSSVPGQAATGQGHLDLHPAAARPHGSHQAELAERQADLGIPDRARLRPRAVIGLLPCTPSSRVGSGSGNPCTGDAVRVAPAEGADPSVDYPG